MKSRQDIIQELRSVLVDHLELEVPAQLQETDRLFEDLNVDSLMALQLLVYIEEVFQISLPDDMADPQVFSSIGSLTSFIESHQEAAV
jgi:acyl carrier protein